MFWEVSNDGMETVRALAFSLLTQALWPSLLPRELELKHLFSNPAGKCHRGIDPGDTEHVQRECFRNTNYQDRIKQQISNNQINRRLSCVGVFWETEIGLRWWKQQMRILWKTHFGEAVKSRQRKKKKGNLIWVRWETIFLSMAGLGCVSVCVTQSLYVSNSTFPPSVYFW